ncbi:MAG: DinB family protein [Saprospiraceae bacterium]|jgi:uncharacterized damage-inducible protein DinB
MKKIASFLCLLFLSTWASAQNDVYLAETIKKWENASGYTMELARAMPIDKFDFAPTDDTRSFQQQLEHMARNMIWLGHSYLGAPEFDHPLKDKKDMSPQECIQFLTASLQFAHDALRGVSTDSLSVVHDFFAGPMTTRQIIALLEDHHTHHRGQLIVYLRLNGITPPKYRGW